MATAECLLHGPCDFIFSHRALASVLPVPAWAPLSRRPAPRLCRALSLQQSPSPAWSRWLALALLRSLRGSPRRSSGCRRFATKILKAVVFTAGFRPPRSSTTSTTWVLRWNAARSSSMRFGRTWLQTSCSSIPTATRSWWRADPSRFTFHIDYFWDQGKHFWDGGAFRSPRPNVFQSTKCSCWAQGMCWAPFLEHDSLAFPRAHSLLGCPGFGADPRGRDLDGADALHGCPLRPCAGPGVLWTRGEAGPALQARRVRLQLVEGTVWSALETLTTIAPQNLGPLSVGLVGFPLPIALLNCLHCFDSCACL